jgi:glycosyltransferase involved in cell wall biosynthesis
MKQWTVIIPTIWRSEYTLNLLQKYQNCEWVNEIILINNAPDKTPAEFIEHSKLVHYKTENIYVNPAWNLGVSMASNNDILISNDDVDYDVDGAFRYVSGLVGWSVLGVDGKSYDRGFKEWGNKNGDSLGFGWGCLIFAHKSEWINIPEGFKIWYGDNWITKKHKAGSIQYKGGIETKMSTSADGKDMLPVLRADTVYWNKIKHTL